MSAAAPPPPPPNNHRNVNGNDAGRGGGKSKHFSATETDMFLSLVRDREPLGQIAWQALADEFSSLVEEDRLRDYAQLQRRFKTLYSKKIPTGDPHMPPEVRLAKHLNYKIQEKAQLVVAADLSDDDEELNLPSGDSPTDDSPNEDAAAPPHAAAPPPAVAASANTPRRAANRTSGYNGTGSRMERARGNHTRGGRISPKNKDESFFAGLIELERIKDKRERRRMRKQEKKDLIKMKMMMTIAMKAINAFSSHISLDKEDRQEVLGMLDDSDDSGSDDSSVNSDDSPGDSRPRRGE